MSSNPVLKFPPLIAVIMMIAACSGGGGSGGAPVSPSDPSGSQAVQSLTISIISPDNGATYSRGQTIQFTASATDPVDGTLSGSALSWTSSKDGSIGLGENFSLNSLSVGTHVVTLKVTDSVGITKTATSTIEVKSVSPNGAPAPTAPPINTLAGYPGASQITINDPDIGQNHTFAITTFPAHGTAIVSTSGIVTYNPTPGFTNGSDSLTVTVTDDGSPRMAGTVTIPIAVSGPVLNLPPSGTAPKIFTVVDTSGKTQIAVTDPVAPDNLSGTSTASTITAATATGTASTINSDILTVAGTVTGTFVAGATLSGANVAPGTKIVEQLTGTTGDAGTYRVDISQSVGSTTITATYGTLTVGGTLTGAFAVGDLLSGAGIDAGTYITQSDTGSGGAGTYYVNDSQTVPSEAIDAAHAQNHTFLVTTPPQNGSASVSAGGVVVYTPRSGFSGDDSLVVTIQDNGTPPMSGNVLINVTVEKAFAFVMTAHPNPVRPGHRIFYSITVSNQGKTPISQVENMQDPTPPYGKFNAAEITGNGSCNAAVCSNGLYVQWQPFGTLNPGESHTLYLALAVNGSAVDGVIPPDGTSIHNGASINHDGGTFAGASQDVQTLSTAGVMLSIDEDRDPVKPGDQLTYTLTLSNLSIDGVSPQHDWTLNATIPEWADFVSADSTYTLSNGAVVWDVSQPHQQPLQPQPGTVLQRHFTVQVKNTVNAGSVLQSEAEVNDIITGQRYAHDVDTTLVKTDTPLQVTMTPGQTPNPLVQAGQGTTYTFTVTNTGTTQLSNISLTDVTPNDSEITSISLGGQCYSDANQQTNKPVCTEGDVVTWPQFTLDPGASVSGYSFTLTPKPAQVLDPNTNTLVDQYGLLIHNTLRVSYSEGDFSLGNDAVVSAGGGPVGTP